MNLYNSFKAQIEQAKQIDDETINKIEYKRVWSGELITVGDKPLFAFVIKDVKGEINNPDNLLLILLLERELNNMEHIFKFHSYNEDNPLIPILLKK
jgi:hypothetical protein